MHGMHLGAKLRIGLRQRRRIGDDLVGIDREARVHRLTEGNGLGSDGVLEGSALEPGEDCPVDLLGQLLGAEDGTTTRTAEGLVGGEGHHVGDSYRTRVGSSGHETRRVR